MSDAGTAGRDRALAWRRLRLVLIAFWCGMTWTIGYIAAPVLFRWLPSRALAGDVAGALFRIQAWTSVVIGIALIVHARLAPRRSDAPRPPVLAQTDVRIAVAMLICTLAGYFALLQVMSALRAAMAGAPVTTEFTIVHGISAGFYLAHALLGVWLVARQAR